MMWQLRQKSDREVYHPAQKTNNSPRKARDISTAKIRTPIRRSFPQDRGHVFPQMS